MSTTVSSAGGLPVGFGIFGFFFVSVPTASAIFCTSAVGLAKVGALVVVSVVAVVAVAAAPVSPAPLGISAVFVPPLPQAARPTQSAIRAGHLRRLWSRITGGTVPSGIKRRGGTRHPRHPRRSAEKSVCRATAPGYTRARNGELQSHRRRRPARRHWRPARRARAVGKSDHADVRPPRLTGGTGAARRPGLSPEPAGGCQAPCPGCQAPCP